MKTSCDPQLVPASVIEAASAAGWPGVVLPQRTIFDVRVYPVVEPMPFAWRVRATAGAELNRPTLAMWEQWQIGMAVEIPPSPLAIVGFVATTTFRSAMNAVRGLAGFGSGLILSASARPPTPWQIRTADFDEVSLAWDSDDGVVLLSGGRIGPVATARRIVATRWIEEVLFDWALRAGVTAPAGEPVLATP